MLVVELELSEFRNIAHEHRSAIVHALELDLNLRLRRSRNELRRRIRVLDLEQLLQRRRPKPLLPLIPKRERLELVSVQLRWENKFSVGFVFDEAWWCEAFDGLIVCRVVSLAASTTSTSTILLHATSAPAVGRSFAAPSLHAETLRRV
jgi:hypothetical protein